MRKIFTKMAGILIGLASMSVPVIGQSVENVQVGKALALTGNLELRAATATDSSITYNARGEYLTKSITWKDGNSSTSLGYRWQNGKWIEDNSIFILYETVYKPKTELHGSQLRFLIPKVRGYGYYYWDSYNGTSETTKDAKGNITEFKYGNMKIVVNYEACIYPFLTDYWTSSIECYENNTLIAQFRYEHSDFEYIFFEHTVRESARQLPGNLGRQVKTYNGQGRLLSYEEHKKDGDNWIFDIRETYEYDSTGKLWEMNEYTGNNYRWMLAQYTIYYPNSQMPNVGVGNNNPVTGINSGFFNLMFNLPSDSLQSGSFTVQMPEGFTLDATKTKLATQFDAFTLSATKQDGNAWLFEIKPKSTRSVALRSDEADKSLAQIAYTVDGAVKRGTYDITISSIQFETPGGSTVPEPVITVPIDVNRWGVGNETVSATHIWTSDGRLHVNTPQTVMLNVYTLSGTLLKQQTVAAGETVIPLPKGAYIVQAGKTVKKTVIRR